MISHWLSEATRPLLSLTYGTEFHEVVFFVAGFFWIMRRLTPFFASGNGLNLTMVQNYEPTVGHCLLLRQR